MLYPPSFSILVVGGNRFRLVRPLKTSYGLYMFLSLKVCILLATNLAAV